ncbi:MAG: YDG domain-containing protein [Propionibacteriaceae bacterium]|nr:YDG domain-containing protein [Propionibacteriaceae bacterium]
MFALLVAGLPLSQVPAVADPSTDWPSGTSDMIPVYFTDRDLDANSDSVPDVTNLPTDWVTDEFVDGYIPMDVPGITGSLTNGCWPIPDTEPQLRGGLELSHYRLYALRPFGGWVYVGDFEPGDCVPQESLDDPSIGVSIMPNRVNLTGVYTYTVTYLDHTDTETVYYPFDHSQTGTAWGYATPLGTDCDGQPDGCTTAAGIRLANAPASSQTFLGWHVDVDGNTLGTLYQPSDTISFDFLLSSGLSQGNISVVPVFDGASPSPSPSPSESTSPSPSPSPSETDTPDRERDGKLTLEKYALRKVPGADCVFPPVSQYDVLEGHRDDYTNDDPITFDPTCVEEIPPGSSIPDGSDITWVYRVYNDSDDTFYPHYPPDVQITIHDDRQGSCVLEVYPDEFPPHDWDMCGISGKPNFSPVGIEATSQVIRVYDGTINAELPGVELTNVDPDDDVTLDYSQAKCYFDKKDVSNSRVVSCTGFSLTGPDADKYELPDNYMLIVHHAVILPKPAKLRLDIVKYDDGRTWLTPSTYDSIWTPSWSGLVAGESLNATWSGTFNFDNMVLGPDHPVTGGNVSLGDGLDGTGDLDNYSITTEVVGELRYSSIVDLTVNVTSTGQTIALNRYFNTDDVMVQWNDTTVEGSNDEYPFDAAKTHTFTQPGTYVVRLVSRIHVNPYLPSPSGCGNPLVPTTGTTVSSVRVTRFPPLKDFVSAGSVTYGNAKANMMCGFNNGGAVLDFVAGSLDTKWIVTAEGNFFQNFNKNGTLTSLPAGSLDTSNIEETVGANFFSSFNENGSLTQLPDGALKTNNIKAVNGNGMFFAYFNRNGKLTSLPAGSMVLDGIKNFRQGAFYGFNNNGALTQLPVGSFNMTNATAASGNMFCYEFNRGGKLTSLPVGSFDISNIKDFGNGFFGHFNSWGDLTSLPAGSFRLNTEKTTIGTGFFSNFNNTGKLTSLPANSFNIGHITSASTDFFRQFNEFGELTSLPTGSFNTSALTSLDNWAFAEFNNGGKLTSLPASSFGFGSLKTVTTHFLWSFNKNGPITAIPANSFNLSSITSAGDHFISYFNANGRMTNVSSFRFPKFTSTSQIGAESFENSFYSLSYTITSPTSMSTIVNGSVAPSTMRGTFSSNQPGVTSLATNWR